MSSLRRRAESPYHYQPFPAPSDWASTSPAADSLLRARVQARTPSYSSHSHAHSHRSNHASTAGRSTGNRSNRGGDREANGTAGGWDTASESGMSVLSAFAPIDAEKDRARRRAARERRRQERQHQAERTRASDATDSPLRRAVKWVVEQPPLAPYALLGAVAVAVLIKWCTGLGGYSGYADPPLRGDLEAQRHWLALTSSSLNSLNLPFLRLHTPPSPSSNASLSPAEWYYHDHTYWGLDYPPLTAYHSLLLGAVARLSPSTSRFVTLRPDSRTASIADLNKWEQEMVALEREGGMKNFMRTSVVVGDLLVWVSAVVVYCRRNYRGSSTRGGKSTRNVLVAALAILLQPALLLIDNGHFQYNSLMLGFTLWALNAFQAGHDCLGSVFFVLSLGFKQMALYYAPAVFAYLLGKCLWLGGRAGFSLFINLGLTVIATFTLLFLPLLFSGGFSTVLQALHRIFPFARGLFEDKVANVWCALNVVVKLRELAPVSTLAKLALAATGLAVLPSVAGTVWVSLQLREREGAAAEEGKSGEGKGRSSAGEKSTSGAATGPAPTAILLPHLLFLSAMSFFLFSFQVHEKSILLPLMPLTMLLGGREVGYGRMDWEWGVLINNVAVFSMWPLLKRDGVATQYFALSFLWNFLIGYNPFSLRASFVKYLSLITYAGIALLHALEALTTPPPHLPDLFPVLNLTLSAAVFGLAWLWASKRVTQEAWALVGLGKGA
ncbi:hypothetical protein JCM10207_000499 [Rhodosporidiobolus poonsookiae]